MLIKKSPHWKSNPSRPHCRQTRYQLKNCGEYKGAFFYATCEATVKEETVECRCLIFWLEFRRGSTAVAYYCQTGAESEGFNRPLVSFGVCRIRKMNKENVTLTLYLPVLSSTYRLCDVCLSS
jgi:hypothetical protein